MISGCRRIWVRTRFKQVRFLAEHFRHPCGQVDQLPPLFGREVSQHTGQTLALLGLDSGEEATAFVGELHQVPAAVLRIKRARDETPRFQRPHELAGGGGPDIKQAHKIRHGGGAAVGQRRQEKPLEPGERVIPSVGTTFHHDAEQLAGGQEVFDRLVRA
jgi:hypothetical protein